MLKGELFNSDGARRQGGVEDRADFKTKIAFQGDQIVIGAMKDLKNRQVFEKRGEGLHRVEENRVKDIVEFRVGNLDQADFFLIAVKRIPFGIDPDDGSAAQRSDGGIPCLRRGDVQKKQKQTNQNKKQQQDGNRLKKTLQRGLE